MNRLELRIRILEGLDESVTDPVFWSGAQLNAMIEEAQEILAEETQALKRTHLLVRTPGSMLFSTHALGERVMTPYRLYARDLDRRLEAVSLHELDARHEQWWEYLGAGDPWVWFSLSWDTFGIWPPSSTGGEIIEVNSLVWPTPLLDDADVPEWPDADHDGLALYGIYDGLCKRWDVPRATQVLAKFLEAYGISRERTGFRIFQERSHQRDMGTGNESRGGVP